MRLQRGSDGDSADGARMAISLKIRRLAQLKRLDVMRIFNAVVAASFISGKTPAFR